MVWRRFFFLSALLCLGTTFAPLPFVQSAEVPTTAADRTIVRIKLAADEVAQVLRLPDFVAAKVEQWPENAPEVMFFTGHPGKYLVIVGGGNAKLRLHNLEIIGENGPNPGPNPPNPGPNPPLPNPDLAGFALEVYRESLKVGDKRGCAKLSANFSAVAAAIGAGTIKSVDDARDKIVALNEQTRSERTAFKDQWLTFANWISKELGARARTLPAAAETFLAIADGLEVAAK